MNFKEFIKGLGILLGYLFTPFLIQIVFYQPIMNLDLFGRSIALLLIHLFVSLIILIHYRHELKKEFQEFVKNPQEKFFKVFKYYILGFIGMYVINIIIINFIGIDLSTNEAQNRSALETMPLYGIIASIIIAPIMEEIVFRKSFKNVFKKPLFFILFTGILFGASHIMNDLTYPNILFLLSYSSLGIAFSYIYAKTNNIFGSITLHMLHNFLAVGLVLLTL